MSSDQTPIAYAVEQALKRQKWTHQRLARELRVSTTTLYRIKSGSTERISLALALQLYEYGGLSLDSLMGVDPSSLAPGINRDSDHLASIDWQLQEMRALLTQLAESSEQVRLLRDLGSKQSEVLSYFLRNNLSSAEISEPETEELTYPETA